MSPSPQSSQTNWLVLLDSISRSLNTTGHTDTQNLNAVLEDIRSELQGTAVAVWTVEKNTDFMRIETHAGLSRQYVRYFNQTDRIRLGKGMVGKVMTERKTKYALNLDDISSNETLPRWRDIMRSEGFKAVLISPMFVAEEIIGAFVVYYNYPLRSLDSDHLQFTEILANLAAVTLDNVSKNNTIAADRKQLCAHLDQVELLQSLTESLNITGRRSLHDAATKLLEFTHHQYDALGLSIFEYNEETGVAKITVTVGASQNLHAFVSEHTNLINEHSLVGRAVRKKEAVLSPKVFTDPVLAKQLKILCSIEGITSVASLPFLFGEKPTGALIVYFAHEHAFEDDEVHTLKTLAQFLGTSINNVTTFDTLTAERENMSHMINSLTDGLVVYDAAGSVTAMNYRAEEFLGVHLEEVAGLHVSHPTILKKAEMHHLHTLMAMSLEEFKKREMTFAEQNGQTFEVMKVPLKDTSGAVQGFMHIMHDITKEKENQMLQKNFIAVASHQLRTPLTGLRWSTDLLHNGNLGPLNPEQQKVVRNEIDSIDQLIGIVGDLVNVSKIEEARFTAKLSQVNILDVCTNVVRQARALLGNKSADVALCFQNTTKTPPIILADVHRLQDAIQNIVDNAVHYTTQGQIIVTLENTGQHIRLIVKDSGVGIPEREQKYVFDKFFRGDIATRTHANGSGLGLFIAKEITELFNGKIWFESMSGKGTVFYLEFPLHHV